jgi:transposase InsO family protein
MARFAVMPPNQINFRRKQAPATQDTNGKLHSAGVASLAVRADVPRAAKEEEPPMKNPSLYLKMRVLGAIDLAPGTSLRERIKSVAGNTFTDEDGHERRFTWRTISTWLYRYRAHGVTGMKAHARSDKGKTRKVAPEELLEALNAARPHFREKRLNKSALFRFCLEKNLLRRDKIAPTTFYRLIREHGLLPKNGGVESKRRLAFAMQHANQLWQADTMFGPFVKDASGRPRTAKLIAFLDDASRVLCHGEFFFDENTDALVSAMRAAFYKRGLPEQLYVDNGSIYSGAEITLVCARVGCLLSHTPVRDGAAKGKVERFFRRVREQFLERRLDLSSLENLNRQFTDWAENEYNHVPHGALGMKPIDRFGLDLARIRFLPPSETADELFYAETKRTVKKDGTFSFAAVRYETPVDLREKRITLRYQRSSRSRVIVYYKEQRMGEARRLNLVANAQLRGHRKENT